MGLAAAEAAAAAAALKEVPLLSGLFVCPTFEQYELELSEEIRSSNLCVRSQERFKKKMISKPI